MTHNTKQISPLRQRMIDDMTMRRTGHTHITLNRPPLPKPECKEGSVER